MKQGNDISVKLFHMALYAVPFSVMFGLIVVASGGVKRNQYIITSKGANKIEYYALKNPADKHIMTFDGDTALTGGGWYQYLNIGDTISGQTRFMNNPVNYSCYYVSLRNRTPITTIERVNGHSLHAMRENARRDSMIREMKQR